MKKLPSTGELATVTQQFPEAAIAFSLLHSSGQLQWLDPFHYTILPGTKIPPITQLGATKQMSQYLLTRQCRWGFLLNTFGFNKEVNWRCGHCDNCY
jgi:ATP-dependent DNA helicase RecQ